MKLLKWRIIIITCQSKVICYSLSYLKYLVSSTFPYQRSAYYHVICGQAQACVKSISNKVMNDGDSSIRKNTDETEFVKASNEMKSQEYVNKNGNRIVHFWKKIQWRWAWKKNTGYRHSVRLPGFRLAKS